MNVSYRQELAWLAATNPYRDGVQPHGLEEERARFRMKEAERQLVREVGREETDRLMEEALKNF